MPAPYGYITETRGTEWKENKMHFYFRNTYTSDKGYLIKDVGMNWISSATLKIYNEIGELKHEKTATYLPEDWDHYQDLVFEINWPFGYVEGWTAELSVVDDVSDTYTYFDGYDGSPTYANFGEQVPNNLPVITIDNVLKDINTIQLDLDITVTDTDKFVETIIMDWGDGNTESNPSEYSHIYNEKGVYKVTVTATDNYGASNSASKIIKMCVFSPPEITNIQQIDNGDGTKDMVIDYEEVIGADKYQLYFEGQTYETDLPTKTLENLPKVETEVLFKGDDGTGYYIENVELTPGLHKNFEISTVTSGDNLTAKVLAKNTTYNLETGYGPIKEIEVGETKIVSEIPVSAINDNKYWYAEISGTKTEIKNNGEDEVDILLPDNLNASDNLNIKCGVETEDGGSINISPTNIKIEPGGILGFKQTLISGNYKKYLSKIPITNPITIEPNTSKVVDALVLTDLFSELKEIDITGNVVSVDKGLVIKLN